MKKMLGISRPPPHDFIPTFDIFNKSSLLPPFMDSMFSLSISLLLMLFAVSVTLLVVAPLALFATGVIVSKNDRMYLFSLHKSPSDQDEKISLKGFRGLFRFPLILVVASAIVVGLAYLLTKFNPYIVHSSPYAVWALMVSAWLFMAWFLSRIADFARPSALHRAYSFTWLFVIMWILLVINTVYQNQHGIAGGYFIVFYFAGTFLATWISYLELFSLPRKVDFANYVVQRESSRSLADDASSHLLAPSADELPSESNPSGSRHSGHTEEHDDGDEEPTESTSLLRGHQRTTFANYTRAGRSEESRHRSSHICEEEYAAVNIPYRGSVFRHEQLWSAGMPTWTWVLQFLLVAPVVLVLVGHIALFLTSALHQVGADGSSIFVVYILIAAFCILLFTPLLPFIHRFTYHVPMTLLFIFIGTLVYTLVAFPFSSSNRLKLAFLQEVDLDSGLNRVSLTGVYPYARSVIDSIPSASGRSVTCDDSESLRGRHQCFWEGIPPNVLATTTSSTNNNKQDDDDSNDWVSYNITKTPTKKNHAKFEISGKNTRACKLKFDTPIKDYVIPGSAVETRMPHLSPHGVSEIRLWSRTWENTWTVEVDWSRGAGGGDGGLRGRVICLWSDDNHTGIIPALDEIRLYAPAWVAITKLQDGLVEASRAFSI